MTKKISEKDKIAVTKIINKLDKTLKNLDNIKKEIEFKIKQEKEKNVK